MDKPILRIVEHPDFDTKGAPLDDKNKRLTESEMDNNFIKLWEKSNSDIKKMVFEINSSNILDTMDNNVGLLVLEEVPGKFIQIVGDVIILRDSNGLRLPNGDRYTTNNMNIGHFGTGQSKGIFFIDMIQSDFFEASDIQHPRMLVLKSNPRESASDILEISIGGQYIDNLYGKDYKHGSLYFYLTHDMMSAQDVGSGKMWIIFDYIIRDINNL
jgi:hypothetical protein